MHDIEERARGIGTMRTALYGRAAIVAFVIVFASGFSPASADVGPASGVAAVPAGAFAVDLMRSAGVPESGWGSESARLLERAGVADHGSPLTEGIAAALLRDLGLQVVAVNSERPVSRARAASIIGRASGLLVPGDDVDFTGASRGGSPAPASVDDCLVLRTHGACVNCCKQTGAAARTCAKLCFVINKQSPSEPLP